MALGRFCSNVIRTGRDAKKSIGGVTGLQQTYEYNGIWRAKWNEGRLAEVTGWYGHLISQA